MTPEELEAKLNSSEFREKIEQTIEDSYWDDYIGEGNEHIEKFN